MANLFDQMKRRLSGNAPSEAAKSQPGGEAAAAPEAVVDDAAAGTVNGVDPRRIAEQKAEEAGRKWRARAEASGEVEKETGGPQGLEPTRYGDWEKAGRCFDF
ncbi:MAG: DUF1674 domain-containing protein [Alphaproteobacteria bacterium]|nr:DUF1674 domain-containing protein [Alphaproteobacteria bacterium]